MSCTYAGSIDAGVASPRWVPVRSSPQLTDFVMIYRSIRPWRCRCTPSARSRGGPAANRRLMKRTATPSASGSLERYLVEISRYPVLTIDQERELARTCRAALVTANLRFVVKIAYQYRSQGF